MHYDSLFVPHTLTLGQKIPVLLLNFQIVPRLRLWAQKDGAHIYRMIKISVHLMTTVQ
jgi:hypothetical protein